MQLPMDELSTDERPFEVAVQGRDGECVVVVRGELDLTAVDELWRSIERVRSDGRPLVVDLAEVTFMDSSGINLLVRAFTAQGRVPEAVVVRSPSDAVRRTLAVAGLDGYFRIDDR